MHFSNGRVSDLARSNKPLPVDLGARSSYYPALLLCDQMGKLLSFACLSLVVWACAESFEHNPKLAAQRAEEFAETVFVRKDFDSGYAMLAESGKRYVPLEKFRDTVLKSHPRAYPSRIAAVDYEPMTGEKAIYIYLSGDNSGEQFNYTVILDGTAATDYKVVRFSRGGSAGSSRQPLGR